MPPPSPFPHKTQLVIVRLVLENFVANTPAPVIGHIASERTIGNNRTMWDRLSSLSIDRLESRSHILSEASSVYVSISVAYLLNRSFTIRVLPPGAFAALSRESVKHCLAYLVSDHRS